MSGIILISNAIEYILSAVRHAIIHTQRVAIVLEVMFSMDRSQWHNITGCPVMLGYVYICVCRARYETMDGTPW